MHDEMRTRGEKVLGKRTRLKRTEKGIKKKRSATLCVCNVEIHRGLSAVLTLFTLMELSRGKVD